jgi:DinB superfamily/Ankyrin repeats (3 copies)
MATDVRDELLELSGHAWRRIRTRLDGMDDDEYFWEPVADCWTIRPDTDGVYRPDFSVLPPEPAPFTTIAWRLAHVTDILAQERNATWLGLEPIVGDDLTAEPNAADAIARFERANSIWEQYLHAVDDDVLWQRVGPIGRGFADSTRVDFVLHELDELIHHGAEIGLLRDLYRAARADDAIDPLVRALLAADRETVGQVQSADPAALGLLRGEQRELVARAAAIGRWDAVCFLVELGFDVNASSGRSALHDAAGAGNLAMVKYLVEHGANTAAIDDLFHVAPIAWAQYFAHHDVIAYLEAAAK